MTRPKPTMNRLETYDNPPFLSFPTRPYLTPIYIYGHIFHVKPHNNFHPLQMAIDFRMQHSRRSPTESVLTVRLSLSSCMISVLSLYESSFKVSSSAIASSKACGGGGNGEVYPCDTVLRLLTAQEVPPVRNLNHSLPKMEFKRISNDKQHV